MKILLYSSLFVAYSLSIGCKSESACDDSDASVTVYSDINYVGASQTFDEGVYFVSSFPSLNDQISSIKVNPCTKVTLCEHQNLGGDLGICHEYTTDQPSIDDLNDKVSYIKIEKNK